MFDREHGLYVSKSDWHCVQIYQKAARLWPSAQETPRTWSGFASPIR